MSNSVQLFLADACEDPYLRRAFMRTPDSELAAAGIDVAVAADLRRGHSPDIYRAAHFDPNPAPKLIWAR